MRWLAVLVLSGMLVGCSTVGYCAACGPWGQGWQECRELAEKWEATWCR